MKIRAGNKLRNIRETKKLTHEGMAELLNLTPSTYGRYERNETSIDIEQLSTFSKTLDVPIHEFLPETFQINNTPNYSQGGLVFGNFNYYANDTDAIRELQKEIEYLKRENELLRSEIKTYTEIIKNK
ncbi:MAG: helix-turn-helix transcriptional regulator [Cytophagales bacterium]